MIDVIREVGRIFKYYFVNLNKLDEKNNQFYKDVSALVSMAYNLGHAQGRILTLETIEKRFKNVLILNGSEPDNIAEIFYKATPHIQREEK